MPNGVKYSTTTPTGSLRRGNVALGVTSNLGPTANTGFYSMPAPQSGKYIINKVSVSGIPNFFAPQNDTELIRLARNEGATGADTGSAAAVLAWMATQDNLEAANIEYENIVTDGLVLNLDAGFVGSYPTTASTWYDLSGNAYNGTLTNGPTFNSANGGYIQFDGANDYVTLGNQSGLGFTSGVFSIEAWIYIPSSWTGGSQYPNLVSKGATAGWDTNGWSLFVFRNWVGPYAWGCGMRNGGSVNVVYRGSCASDTYLNVVMTLDGSNVRLYENGSSITSETQTVNPGSNSTAVYVGADVNLQCFPGRVASCKAYNRTLSATEVLQNYNAQKGRFGL